MSKKRSKKVAKIIELDINPEEEANLQRIVDKLKRDSYQLGKETRPEIYHYEKPCIITKAREKKPTARVDGHTLDTPYAIVYALEFRARPGKGSVISHQCGRGPSCIEPSHLHIILIGENNEKAKCHNRIRDGVKDWESDPDKSVEDREGTIFYEGCKHKNRPCFKQFGKLESDEEIWD